MQLAHERTGSGEPLLLLHGLGNDRSVWHRVLPALRERFEVVLADLPGHGASPPLPPGARWTPGEYAGAVAGLLDGLGLAAAHLVGSSLGGWAALELAKAGRARSVTALAPGGLWARGLPPHAATVLAGNRLAARRTPWLLRAQTLTRPTRKAGFLHLVARGGQLSRGEANRLVSALAATRGYEPTLAALRRSRFLDGRGLPVSVPVTVAYGAADLLLPPRTRRFDQLPAHTRHADLPRCGHLPMLDDAGLVLETISAGARPGSVPS